MTTPLVQRIDALLPQTQCTRCGYPTCRDYAQAMASAQADINQCPPGGVAGIRALSRLLGRPAAPLNPANGAEKPMAVAVIDEDACIGCTKCIQVCPVDAILGANKLMHTILREECSGCELCIPACPVDCISLQPSAAAAPSREAVLTAAQHYRQRFEARTLRLAREHDEQARAIAERKAALHDAAHDAVSAAIARAKLKKGSAAP